MKRRILLLIVIMAAITGLAYLLFDYLGLTNPDELKEIILSTGYLAIFVYILLYITQSLFLQFIPVTGSLLIVVSVMIFGSLGGAIISAIAVLTITLLFYWLGAVIPEHKLVRLFRINQEDLDKAKRLVNSTNTKIAFPLMMLFPVFPDDVLCFVAGISKMNFKYFILATFIPRIIGVFTFVYFGGLFITLSLLEMFIVGNIFIIDMYIVFKNKHTIEKWFSKKEDRHERGIRTTSDTD